MVSDQPFVSYKKDSDKKVTKSQADKLAEEWAEKKKKEGKKISLSEMFGGDDVKRENIWQV